MIIGGSRSEKKTLINLIIEEDNHDFIDKIFLYANDLNKPEYQFLIEKHEDIGIKYFNDPNAFTECCSTIDDVFENIDDYNLRRRKERKKIIAFDDLIADIMANRRFQAIIKELFIRCRKLNVSLVFITQSYFSVQKDVRLNSTHYLIMKINNRKELQNIAISHSTDIDYQDFMKIYRECTKEPYNLLTINTTLPASNPLSLRRNLIRIKMKVDDQIKILNNFKSKF